jgi:thymidylate kinase
MLVTILGPDGTGKTTLAKELACKLDNFEYVYFGYNNESRHYKYGERFIKSDLNNVFLKAVRKLLVFWNDLYYYRLGTKKNIISDRCPLDSYIATKIRGSRMKNYYYFLSLISPNPEYVILLVGDPQIIYERKREITVQNIAKTIDYYKKYLAKNGIRFSTIDTSKNGVERTLFLATNIMGNEVL